MMPRRSAADLRWAHATARLTLLCGVLALLAAFPREAGSRADRVHLFPNLQAGQILDYQISYRSARQTRTQSSIVMAQTPPEARIDLRGQLRMEVLGVESQGPQGQEYRATIHARAWFRSLDS